MSDLKDLDKVNVLKIQKRTRYRPGRDIPVCDGQVRDERTGIFPGKSGTRSGKALKNSIAQSGPPLVRDYPGEDRAFCERAESLHTRNEGGKAFRRSIDGIFHHQERPFVVHRERRYQGYVKGRRESGTAAKLLAHPVPAPVEGFRERLGREDADKVRLIRQSGW